MVEAGNHLGCLFSVYYLVGWEGRRDTGGEGGDGGKEGGEGGGKEEEERKRIRNTQCGSVKLHVMYTVEVRGGKVGGKGALEEDNGSGSEEEKEVGQP